MRKLSVALLAIFGCALFISCQKEVSHNEVASSISIIGTYKFISTQANTNTSAQTTQGTDVFKTITIAQYVTKENSGMIKFDASTLSNINMTYSIDTVMTALTYFNGILIDSSEFPLQVKVTPSTSAVPYKMIGTDSIYFSSGLMVYGGSMQQTVPGGAKIKIVGDKLYMTITQNITSTQTNQGQTVRLSTLLLATSIFQKM